MKFTLGWLQDHLDTSASLADITTRLTSLGLELEGVEDRAAAFSAFKVAHVLEAKKHPDADRLKVLMVDTGSQKIQVVCGAPNARAGMKGIFAPDGSFIPGTGVTLKKGVIRGQESNGMMVSEREMGLSDDHEGIIDLPADTPIGTPFADIYGLNDPVIDVAVTPNRADCAGVRGIARDLAAAGLGTLKPLNETPIKGAFESPIKVILSFDSHTQSACPLFIGRYIRGVKNGPSPEWLQNRLKAVGLRPISALVDITNYFSIGLCRPLHVFDADKMKGNITVRLAKKGETLDALNDKTYTLDDFMTAVCDDSGVVGIGGIMGGLSTGCSDQTTNVYLECAYFDPARTAKTGRALDIISDARYRFERGVDPAFLDHATDLATRMILELCGGEPSHIVRAGETPNWKRTIPFDPAFTRKIGGVDVPDDQQITILKSLGFDVDGKNAPYTVTPPSWRGDILGKQDLVEEITRVYGFDHIPAVSVRSERAISTGAETDNAARSRKARSALCVRGLSECVTWSFMPQDTARLFGSNDNPALTLTNPISSELTQMRPSIIPNLMAAAQRNADRGYPHAALFEIGPVFEGVSIDQQKTVATGVRFGAVGARHWDGAAQHRVVDALDAKADAIAALAGAGAPVGNLQITRDAPSYYHPGRSGALKLGTVTLAYFGEVHPGVLEQLDIKGPVAAFEAFLNAQNPPKKKSSAKPLLTLSPFQPVTRDFAFIVEQTIEGEMIMKAARSADKKIDRVEIFDIYQGKGVADGCKSVAINVTIHPDDHTLSDAEIEAICKKIIESVAVKCRATLRG